MTDSMAGGKLYGRAQSIKSQKYKHNPVLRRAGVYEIVCIVTGKRYIGSTTLSFKKRFRCHLHLLRKGKHHSRYLQRAWDKHGAGSFRFNPLIFCAPGEVLIYEQMLIDKFSPEFNIAPMAGNCAGIPREINTGAKHEVCGELLTIRQIAEKYGFNAGTIQFRISSGLRGNDLISPLWEKHAEAIRAWKLNNPEADAARIAKATETKRFKYDIRGEMLSKYDIAKKYGFKIWTINRRIERGLRGEELIAPLHPAKGKRRDWNNDHARRKNAKRYLVHGENLTIHELSLKYGVDKKLLFDRRKRGVSGDDLVRPKQVRP